MLRKTVKTIRRAYSGQRAREDVAAISRHHRIQASPGYRAAANYILDECLKADLQAQIETYPANYQSKFWTAGSFQEWSCSGATLHLTQPVDQARKLADYQELKLSLIQRSAPFQGEAEIVVLEDGLTEEEYEELELAGKIVLTRGAPERVRQLAVEQHGAIGILFDGMTEVPPVREAMDLPDARQYTSFWWRGLPEEKQCFGFVLSPREGESLRRLIRKRAAKGDSPVKARADVDSEFLDGQIEIVTALIPGTSPETVIIVSHLCHPQPSANDNASGAAANLEAARILQQLINDGVLPQPQRNIQFLWMPEMTGSYAYLARHEDMIPNLVAGLNLDMVGEDQAQTGSVLAIARPPEASASFTPDLLEWLQETVLNDFQPFDGIGHYSLQRYTTVGFTGGSDHYIFSDPTVGVPMPMLNQWPDKFYHSSADTLDKVDPDSLARAGTIAAAYAYFIASVDADKVTWLAHEMLVRFRKRISNLVQNYVTTVAIGTGNDISKADQATLEQRTAFWLDRHRVALQSLIRLGGSSRSLSDMLYYDAARFVNRELERARRIAGQVSTNVTTEQNTESDSGPDEWETKAAGMVPSRKYRGPASLISGGLAKLPLEERSAWFNLTSARQAGRFTIPALAEYWADGRRTALEIVDLVEMETDVRDAELVVSWFTLLQRLDLVDF